jgi:hypothetical protein
MGGSFLLTSIGYDACLLQMRRKACSSCSFDVGLTLTRSLPRQDQEEMCGEVMWLRGVVEGGMRLPDHGQEDCWCSLRASEQERAAAEHSGTHMSGQ